MARFPGTDGGIDMTNSSDTLEQRYEWVVDVMSSLAVTTIVKRVIALATLTMAVIATLQLGLGYAATSSLGLVLQWACMLFAFAATAWWWVTPWPLISAAFTFVIGADIAMFISISVANTPPAIWLASTALFIEIGMFVGFFLGRWMLVSHVLLCTAFTTFIALWVVAVDGVDPLMAAFVWAPIVVSISGFVLLLQFCAHWVRVEFD